jgi:hypothetical protein
VGDCALQEIEMTAKVTLVIEIPQGTKEDVIEATIRGAAKEAEVAAARWVKIMTETGTVRIENIS